MTYALNQYNVTTGPRHGSPDHSPTTGLIKPNLCNLENIVKGEKIIEHDGPDTVVSKYIHGADPLLAYKNGHGSRNKGGRNLNATFTWLSWGP
jgi:hypothetical protein